MFCYCLQEETIAAAILIIILNLVMDSRLAWLVPMARILINTGLACVNARKTTSRTTKMATLLAQLVRTTRLTM